MKCPHCLVEFHDEKQVNTLPNDSLGMWYIESYLCANRDCGKGIHFLVNGEYSWDRYGSSYELGKVTSKKQIYPIGFNRPPVPVEVPDHVASDYKESCLIVTESPKASAALSRRCLQNLLLDKAGVSNGDLSRQIQTVIDSRQLPSHLAEDIDAIRNIGNYAAHPNKSLTTGEIIEVEPNEAEWNLEVLEALFDYYYVQPERARRRRQALNAKLADSGKPSMK